MKVIVDVCVVPIGAGVSLSRYVAICQQVLSQSRLSFQMHANGTGVEGEWDEVFSAIQQCHEAIHAAGAPRISTTIRLDTRTDRDQTMAEKMNRVAVELGSEYMESE